MCEKHDSYRKPFDSDFNGDIRISIGIRIWIRMRISPVLHDAAQLLFGDQQPEYNMWYLNIYKTKLKCSSFKSSTLP